MKDIHSLAHTKWNCKYHIVFAPKYRRKIFYGEKKLEIGKILRELCKWKGVNIIEAEVKYKYRGREFWCRGYYVDTVGKNTKAIAEYIKNQLKEDELNQQLVLDYGDQFTGDK